VSSRFATSVRCARRSRATRERAFHNTWLHRGRQLRESDGHASEFRYPFHGWTWGLDGALLRAPCRWDFEQAPRETYRLPEARTGTWGGFVFVNLDPGCTPLAGIGDANSHYDVWDTFSRAITPNITPSPHLDWEPSEQDQLDSMLSRSLDAEPTMRVPDGRAAREMLAMLARMQLQSVVPAAQDLCDAELTDSFYYTLFPNLHPWGAYNRIVYRLRPYRNDPDRCSMEVI